jgi:predicted Zn-dependent protease
MMHLGLLPRDRSRRWRPWIAACCLAGAALGLCSGAAFGQSSLEGPYGAGVAALERGEALAALDLLGQVAEQDPGYRDVQMLLGRGCLQAGLPRAAKKHFEAAFQQQPSNGQAAFFLGYALFEEARYFEAAEILAKGQQLAPQSPLPRLYRGLALLRQGQAEAARKEIEGGLALAPGDAAGELALAELDLAAGSFGPAEARVRAVLRKDPARVDAQILLGRIRLEGGKAAEAVPVFAELVASQPPRSDLVYLLAQAQLRSGAREEGKKTLDRFKKLKQVESDVRLLELAVSTAPEDFEARLRLAQTMVDHGMERGAVIHVSTLQRQRPQDPRIQALARRLKRP